MIEHGTEAFVLPPSAVLYAAEADVKRYQRNSSVEHMPGMEQYAFHRRDVRKVCRDNSNVTGADIIKEALNHLERGQTSGKANTRMLYNKPELLKAAIGETGDERS